MADLQYELFYVHEPQDDLNVTGLLAPILAYGQIDFLLSSINCKCHVTNDSRAEKLPSDMMLMPSSILPVTV